MVSQTNLDHLSINTIRTLAMDAVQMTHSGRPGTAMALGTVTIREKAAHASRPLLGDTTK